MDFLAHLANTNENLAKYREVCPDGAAGFTAMHKASMSPGAISVKNKELIALAIGIVQNCTDCIGFHVKAALRAGATREEIAETISVCVLMGGGPAYMYGAQAMEAVDQLIEG